MLRVTEIFTSIQGETTFSGWPSSFVRLTGCNLLCRWCDTRYAHRGGEPWEVERIIGAVSPLALPSRGPRALSAICCSRPSRTTETVARRRSGMTPEERARDERVARFYERGLALVTGDVVYGDRRAMDERLLTYTSTPLEQNTEITGTAVVRLYVTSTETDSSSMPRMSPAE